MRNKLFVGYTTGSALPDITADQAKKLTHLNIAFGVVEDGIISIDKIVKFFRFIPKLRKYNPKLNILLSTGGGDALGHGPATATPVALDKFVKSTMKIVRDYKLDGIDCDWEFPGSTGIPEEKYQHTNLLKAYREELDKYEEERGKKCFLTIAAAAGQWFIDTTEMDKIHQYLDFINLMTYDMRGWAQPTGHHTNLYEPENAPVKFSANEGIKLLIDIGVPKEKIVIGVAFYSRRWDGVKNINNGMHQLAETIGDFGPDYTAIYNIYEKNHNFIKYWDDVAKASWLFDGDSFISYDDPKSIQYKCEYVKDLGLGGVMYWQHGADRTGVLFNAIYNNLML